MLGIAAARPRRSCLRCVVRSRLSSWITAGMRRSMRSPITCHSPRPGAWRPAPDCQDCGVTLPRGALRAAPPKRLVPTLLRDDDNLRMRHNRVLHDLVHLLVNLVALACRAGLSHWLVALACRAGRAIVVADYSALLYCWSDRLNIVASLEKRIGGSPRATGCRGGEQCLTHRRGRFGRWLGFWRCSCRAASPWPLRN